MNDKVLNELYATEKNLFYAIQDHQALMMNQLQKTTDPLKTLIVAGIGILLILGIVILWNQRKIKKMLRELQEQLKDKPQE